MIVYQDFSKKDRKLIEPLLTICVQKEIENFLKDRVPEFQQLTNSNHEDIRVPFWAFHEKFEDFSKTLERKYDGYSHRDLPMMITCGLVDGYLKEEDFSGFSEDGKAKFADLKNRIIAIRS